MKKQLTDKIIPQCGDFVELGCTINAIIDYLDYLTPEEPTTCGKVLSTHAGVDNRCGNPSPCYLHEKNKNVTTGEIWKRENPDKCGRPNSSSSNGIWCENEKGWCCIHDKEYAERLRERGAVIGVYPLNNLGLSIHDKCWCGEVVLGIADSRVVGNIVHGKRFPCGQITTSNANSIRSKLAEPHLCGDCLKGVHCEGNEVGCQCECSKMYTQVFEPALPKDWGKILVDGKLVDFGTLKSESNVEFKESGSFKSSIVEYDATTKILKIDISKLPNHKLQEATNRAYAKGQENGKKQGRKEEREKALKYVEEWREDASAGMDDLINYFKN